MSHANSAVPSTGWSRTCRRALPALLWAAIIFAFSSQPDLPRVPQSLLDLIVKKGAHTAEYAILAILIWHALAPARARLTCGTLFMAWALAVLYAISDEVHQSFVPGRTAAATDVLIDGIGAALGLGAVVLVGRRRAAPLAGSSLAGTGQQ